MKNLNRIYQFILFTVALTFFGCDVDSTDFDIDDRDVYIESILIEAKNNSFLEADIEAAVVNPSRLITASLPPEAEGQQVVLTINLPSGIESTPASGQSVAAGESTLLAYGFGLEEEFDIQLNVLAPFQSDKEFVSVWRVDAGGEITLPLEEDGEYNFKVFWGDGEEDIVAGYDLSSASHTYAEAGDYQVVIWGDINGFNFDATKASRDNIIDITDWGQLKLGNNGGYFRGCSNLQVSATNAPDLSETTNFRTMFREASSFNSNINHWDVSGVTSMWDMFYKATNFDQPLDNWDVSNVETFETMFSESAFNQDISSWDVGSATTMKNMFRKSPFNQPIGNWNVANVTSFQSTFRDNKVFDQDLSGWGNKLGNVVTMREMFRGSNYNGDLSAWDMSKVESMWDMFKDAEFNNASIANWDLSSMDNMETMFGGKNCKFNQDISSWDVSNVVNMQNLFKENQVFNQDLSGWDVSNVKCNLDFDTDSPNWDDAHKPQFLVSKFDNNSFCSRPN